MLFSVFTLDRSCFRRGLPDGGQFVPPTLSKTTMAASGAQTTSPFREPTDPITPLNVRSP